MAFPRRFMAFHPDEKLTAAIDRHRSAVAGARRTTAKTVRIANAAQKAAADALKLVDQTWMFETDGTRPEPPLV